VVKEVLKHDVEIETSSSFDIDLVRRLFEEEFIDKQTIIVNNGFKTREYAEKISSLINEGFENVIPVLDNKEELAFYRGNGEGPVQPGPPGGNGRGAELSSSIPAALASVPPKSSASTRSASRSNPKFNLTMLHFFRGHGHQGYHLLLGRAEKGREDVL
jgi:arginine decarboxylase